MRLTYWCAPCLTDHRCYSIREKTRTAAKLKLKSTVPGTDFGPIRKVTVHYDSGFCLMLGGADEGGLFEGHGDEAVAVETWV